MAIDVYTYRWSNELEVPTMRPYTLVISSSQYNQALYQLISSRVNYLPAFILSGSESRRLKARDGRVQSEHWMRDKKTNYIWLPALLLFGCMHAWCSTSLHRMW